MRRFDIILIAILIFPVLLGCEDFLDEAPITTLNTENFFEEEKDFGQAVNAAYRSLHSLSGNRVGENGSYWSFSEMRSDNSTFMFNPIDRSGQDFWQLDTFIMNSQNDLVTSFWRESYAGIGKCNSVIVFSEGMDYENKERYIGEAKFLRALYYSYLVRYFGNVPLVTRAAESYEEAFAGNEKVSKEQIQELIIADLNDAKASLPQSYTDDQLGRATEGAARTLLAKELMGLERYGEAKTELEQVRASGQYALLNDYASVFDINNNNNSELVFSIQYIEGAFDLFSSYMYIFAPWNATADLLGHNQLISRTGMNIPSVDLIDSFEEGDERLAMIDTSYIDSEYGTYNDSIVPFTRKYWHPGHTVERQTGADFPLFRYPHVLLMLAECYLVDGGGDPLPLVNEVRNRAGIQPLSTVDLDDIVQERRVEFHCEADRWDVLVRTGKVNEIMEAHGASQRENRPPDVVGNEGYRNIKILYPIPASELETDPDLEQNPEYQ